ncbi:MAG: SagB/ThcOx family dehydrogenase [Rickettsiales bacterium]|jgi:nitroreductase|nr:SagB/ThcOx family dehydrogenase [Rickettsiales bacterium]
MKKSLIYIIILVTAAAAVLLVIREKKRRIEMAGKSVELPAPATAGGMPIMDALRNRRSGRAFAPAAIPNDMLSNLLWAANGINREDGHHTAPTARNMNEIDLYAISADGIFRFVPDGHRLEKISGENITAATGYNAPLTIAMVADMEKAASREMAYADCGFIGQNIYLFAAANGLETVFKGSVDKQVVEKLRLAEKQELLFVQDVGFKAEE